MSMLKAAVKSAVKKRIKRDPKAVAKKIQREKAVDLGTPARVDETKVLKGQSQATDQADMVRVGRAEVGKRSKGISKEYKATEKRLEKLQTDLKQVKAFLKGAADDKQKKTLSAKVSKITEQVQIQKNKLTDMKKKNLIRRKEGGSMKKKKSTIKDVKQKPTPPADYTESSGNRKLEIKMGIVKQTDLDDLVNFNEGKKIPGSKVIKKMGGGYMKKKMAGGGSLKPVDAEKNPGLSKLPTPVRNRMGFAKGGGKVYKRGHGGKAITSKMSGKDLVNACYDKSL